MLLIKLGIQDFVRDGLTLDDGLEIVRHSCNNCWPGPGEYGIACRAPDR